MSGASGNPFNGRAIAALIVAGLIGFVGFWVLTAFAPELGGGRNAQAHALSRSAVGFAGIVELAKAGGLSTHVTRRPAEGVPGAERSELGGLLVLTPPIGTSRAQIDERIRDFGGSVLIILPKHVTHPDPMGRDRVLPARRGDGPQVQLDDAAAMLAGEVEGIRRTYRTNGNVAGRRPISVNPWGEGAISLILPNSLQSITQHDGNGMRPIISVGEQVIVAELPGRGSTYVLSEPDLLNNLAIKDDARAASAFALLRALAGPDEPVAFDVSLNGLGGGGRSLLRTAFVPPFLGLTLCLLAGGVLALWQGFVRFGPPWREARRIALGKAALVANGAALIVQARRVPHFAARYSAMVREAVARRLHAPARLDGAELDRWLDRFVDHRGKRFSDYLARLEAARGSGDCVESAGALGQWRKEILRDSE